MIRITFIGHSCREQGRGSKTLHQQNPPVFNWHITCTIGRKTIVVVVVVIVVGYS